MKVYASTQYRGYQGMQYDSYPWACDLGQAEGGRCQSGVVPPLTKFQCIERLELNVQL